MPANQSLVSSFFRPRSVRADDESSAAEREETETTIPPQVCAPVRVRVRVRVPMELPPGWKILPLTPSGSSWVVHVRGFCPTPSKRTFRDFWKKHPNEKHSLVLFGKTVWENRYSQMYSVEPAQQQQQKQQQLQQQQQQQQQQCGHPPGSYRYTYSGTSRVCLPCDPSELDEKFAMDLCLAADRIAPVLLRAARLRRECNGVCSSSSSSNNSSSSSSTISGDQPIYNCCLVNWYTPDHTIGLHSDNEAELDPFWPILSVSWGGPRRFLLRAKPSVGKDVHEFWLRDGDLLVMGGKCQEEFKHEVPKVRKTLDGVVGDRICWTMRRLRYRTGNGSSNGNSNSNSNGNGNGKIQSRQSRSSATTTDGASKRKSPRDDDHHAIDASRKKGVLYNPYARRKSSS